MRSGDTALALIPARGGSVGIPGKNLVSLAGKPLIAYAAEVARAAEIFQDIVVTTDSEDIARVASQYGARVPFLRPRDLATSAAPVFPAVLHALDWLAEHEERHFEVVMLLQPTSPLRTPDDLRRAMTLLREHPEADSVVSVCRVEEPHPFKLLKLQDGYVSPFIEWEGDFYYGPRQSLPEVFARNGAIYLSRTSSMRRHGTLLGPRPLAYEMPPERSVNIDSHLDLLFAETLLKGDG